MVRPAAAIVTMVDPVANAGGADTLEARLADARKRHADGEYGTIPLLIVELGIRSQWATEHPSRPVSPRPVRNEGVVDDEVDGGVRISVHDGMKQRGVIKVDDGVDRSQARVQRSTASAGSSRADGDGRRRSPLQSGTKAVFVDMAPSDGVKHVHGFNGALQPVEGRGTVALQGAAGKRVLIPYVLYVPGVQANLLSAGQLKESGVHVKGDGHGSANDRLGDEIHP
ncbi:unnamed protein product [Closterium sp. NIES-54]